ncbi:glutaminyl-peptide cyclotransferase [Pseudoduganella lutea]|uniref:Glutaminyl-peptide cyclotransferase n=1 Tax=Pseudoduganella lutea TaxID=321985 RepID=A0A4V0Z3D3_9BURK|nr:glutaminyl-peptide cyclotransferase [Pseudoduganella lutea]QBE63043.1 glutaminyl-peptide cyclotransferase [Pseudoduganella lutea]
MLTRTFLAALAFACSAIVQAAVPVYGYAVKNTYPHDTAAFTQGLFYRDGVLYESTGQYGASSIRKVELETGAVLQKHDLPANYFGEGIAPFGERIYSLTWTNEQGFIFDIDTFEQVGSFGYQGQGWGLTSDGKLLYMSDGTAFIRVLDPATMGVLRRIRVTADGIPVGQLNELEWVGNEIFANIWQTDRIARIDPVTGNVRGWIDLTGLDELAGVAPGADNVLNGIAWDSTNRRLFVTGKRWPKLFEIRLNKK